MSFRFKWLQAIEVKTDLKMSIPTRSTKFAPHQGQGMDPPALRPHGQRAPFWLDTVPNRGLWLQGHLHVLPRFTWKLGKGMLLGAGWQRRWSVCFPFAGGASVESTSEMRSGRPSEKTRFISSCNSFLMQKNAVVVFRKTRSMVDPNANLECWTQITFESSPLSPWNPWNPSLQPSPQTTRRTQRTRRTLSFAASAEPELLVAGSLLWEVEYSTTHYGYITYVPFQKYTNLQVCTQYAWIICIYIYRWFIFKYSIQIKTIYSNMSMKVHAQTGKQIHITFYHERWGWGWSGSVTVLIAFIFTCMHVMGKCSVATKSVLKVTGNNHHNYCRIYYSKYK